MLKTRIDYPENTGNVQTEIELSVKLKTTTNEKGEILYYAPIEIKDKADLANYGITWDDCKTLHFGQSDRVTVYYFPTTSKAFADSQWAELNTQHSRSYRSVRCKIQGKRKKLINCPDKNKCSACPFGRKPEDRKANIISWDELIENGYEEQTEDKELAARLAWMEFEKVKEWMDAKDPNIARAIVLKEMQGYEVSEIAQKLGITERQVYYCLQQAKTIGKKYKEKYDHE